MSLTDSSLKISYMYTISFDHRHPPAYPSPDLLGLPSTSPSQLYVIVLVFLERKITHWRQLWLPVWMCKRGSAPGMGALPAVFRDVFNAAGSC